MRRIVPICFVILALVAVLTVSIKMGLFRSLNAIQDPIYLVIFTVSDKNVNVNYLTLSFKQVQDLYRKLAGLLGEDNIQLVEYTRQSDGFTGFTAKLTQFGTDSLPDNLTEHAKWDSVFGYHLNYSKQKYIGRVVTPDHPEDVFSCSADSDCVLVTADCCGCASGGHETAVSKKHQIYWENKIASECSSKHAACLAVYMCKPGSTAVCQAGRCSYKITD